MSFCENLDTGLLQSLLRNPDRPVMAEHAGMSYRAQIALPYYRKRLEEHYADILPQGLEPFCRQAEIPFGLEHYGVVFDLDAATEVHPHDQEGVLNEGLRMLISRLGAVIIRNANMVTHLREYGHKNRFPHLNFHIDRSANQPTQYSMYARDPFDEEQKFPRTSSTLFVPTIVGYLQGVREGLIKPSVDKGARATYTIFTQEDMGQLLGNIILEHRWDRPEGTGEISMLDNRTSLHSSYYRDPYNKGYKIGVRYLA